MADLCRIVDGRANKGGAVATPTVPAERDNAGRWSSLRHGQAGASTEQRFL